MKNKTEYESFDQTMDKLLKVSHSDLKTKLDAEKKAKKRKSKVPSASGRA
jgi:hypothetical protein